MVNYYITEAGFNFLEEALTRRQKLGIGLTAGAATLFGASRVGGKVSSPTPPRPNIVQQQSPRVGPEVLQKPSSKSEKDTPTRTPVPHVETPAEKESYRHRLWVHQNMRAIPGFKVRPKGWDKEEDN